MAFVFGPAWIHVYPDENAAHDGKVEINATWAAFAVGVSSLLMGSSDATGGIGTPDEGYRVISGGATYHPVAFDIELTGKNTLGKKVVFTGYDFKADSHTLPFQHAAFAYPAFKARLKLADASLVPWRLAVEN